MGAVDGPRSIIDLTHSVPQATVPGVAVKQRSGVAAGALQPNPTARRVERDVDSALGSRLGVALSRWRAYRRDRIARLPPLVDHERPICLLGRPDETKA